MIFILDSENAKLHDSLLAWPTSGGLQDIHLAGNIFSPTYGSSPRMEELVRQDRERAAVA